jgi:hypothetical protein
MTHPQTKTLVRLAEQLAQLEPARLAAMVSMLPPDAILAVRIGADVALDRADRQLAELLRADYGDGPWHRTNLLTELTELDMVRYPPNGDRAEWVQHGPAGRPALEVAA